MSLTVLVTGADGFFGRLLVPLLRDHAHVLAGIRRAGPTRRDAIEIGDLAALPDLTEKLRGVDVVVHCAARAHVLRDDAEDPLRQFMRVNCDATLHLASQAAAAGVKRFVFLSSIGVNGNQTDGVPFRASDKADPKAPYAISKQAAEIRLAEIGAETGLEVVIIRPPLIIGPNPVGNLGLLARLISTGLPLPFALASRNRRSLVSARVLADLIRVCLTHPRAPAGVLLVADEPPMSTRRILERLAEETGQTLRLFPVPVSLLRAFLAIAGRNSLAHQLFGDLEVDITATKSRLDWTPPVEKG